MNYDEIKALVYQVKITKRTLNLSGMLQLEDEELLVSFRSALMVKFDDHLVALHKLSKEELVDYITR